jgi:hypothetical protein
MAFTPDDGIAVVNGRPKRLGSAKSKEYIRSRAGAPEPAAFAMQQIRVNSCPFAVVLTLFALFAFSRLFQSRLETGLDGSVIRNGRRSTRYRV